MNTACGMLLFLTLKALLPSVESTFFYPAFPFCNSGFDFVVMLNLLLI